LTRAGRTSGPAGGRLPIGADAISQTEAALLLRVLQYAPTDEPRGRLRRVFEAMGRAAAAFRTVTITRKEATLLWEDVTWLGHLLGPKDGPALEAIGDRLAAIMREHTADRTKNASA
jgi:hypothetical protein